jgi:hypothetical protein
MMGNYKNFRMMMRNCDYMQDCSTNISRGVRNN